MTDHTSQTRTVTVTLTQEQAAFIDAAVARGEYADAAEAVADGVEHLREVEEYDPALREAVLLHALEEADRDFERGDYVTLDTVEDVDQFFNDLRVESRHRRDERRRAWGPIISDRPPENWDDPGRQRGSVRVFGTGSV